MFEDSQDYNTMKSCLKTQKRGENIPCHLLVSPLPSPSWSLPWLTSVLKAFSGLCFHTVNVNSWGWGGRGQPARVSSPLSPHRPGMELTKVAAEPSHWCTGHFLHVSSIIVFQNSQPQVTWPWNHTALIHAAVSTRFDMYKNLVCILCYRPLEVKAYTSKSQHN